MAWPICPAPDCGGREIDQDGPGYDVHGASVVLWRSHRCRRCGWRWWTRQEIASEGPSLAIAIRAKFGGFVKSRALSSLFRPREDQPGDLQKLLFDD